MSHRTKSGWKQKRHQSKQRRIRRYKRKKADLIAKGFIKKGPSPKPSA